ncbi:MAG: hypothetical protein KME15_08260 [Drouetiella hepatica Uher 2000/2452]|jgi:hypothetical protein|uniref:Uncharacterized protein n=1 Tax=Drouetiella hepatica Uher 2000/2452 TaxID=904376 RepID=A0A951Q9E7_9CYAN|nr:hypothetical protein [Drouetiella hepatica Uher 2000/2452]
MWGINTIRTLADKELASKASGYQQAKVPPPLCKSITPVSFGISRFQAKIKLHDHQNLSVHKPLQPSSSSYYVHQLANPSRMEELNFIVSSLNKSTTQAVRGSVIHSYSSDKLPYSNKEEQDYLENQSKLFKEKLPELVKDYPNKYVLFENGLVLLSHDDEATLMKTAYGTMGLRPLFVRKVLKEEPKFTIWTPLIC